MRTALGNAPMRTLPDSPVRAAASDAVAASRAARHSFGVLHEGRAGGRERDAPADVLQQRHARLPLQRGELLRHRGRRVGVRLGHGGDGAQMGQVPQQAQAADIKH